MNNKPILRQSARQEQNWKSPISSYRAASVSVNCLEAKSIQTDVDVADDEDRVVECRDLVERIRQLSEEGLRHWTSPVDYGGNAGR